VALAVVDRQALRLAAQECRVKVTTAEPAAQAMAAGAVVVLVLLAQTGQAT
jgi:hypothetical protein